MKESWEEQLRRKLEGHRKTPPAGLWEGISREMKLKAEPVRKPVAIRRWWWAAAAVILVLVGFFVSQNGNDSEQLSEQTNAVSQPSAPQQPVSQPLLPQQPISPLSNEQPKEASVAQKPQAEAALLATSDLVKENLSSIAEHQIEEMSYDSLMEVQQTPYEPEAKQLAENSNDILAPQYESVPKHTTHSSSGKWSVGLNASGGLLAANNNVGIQSQIYDANNYSSEKSGIAFVNGSAIHYNNYSANHHLPVRFGLSAQYQLNSNLALLGGVSYTHLYSEFSLPQYKLNYSYKLHYLGIPLGVVWQLWSISNLKFYVSGGAMLEKCLSADTEGGINVSEKPWQWSIDAAVGAEYGFTRHLGFYLEPSLGYYFDDGTSLEHYYKEHPLAPSIEFGLRLHLNE